MRPSPDQVDRLLERAKRLPRDLSLTVPLLLDVWSLRLTWIWLGEQRDVPTSAWAVIGLTINHLEARIATCEERAGERRAGA